MSRFNDDQKTLLTLGILLGIFILFISGYHMYTNYRLSHQNRKECDLHEHACTVAIRNQGSVTFSITPRAIPLQIPLTVDVDLQGMQPQSVHVKMLNVHIPTCHVAEDLQAQSKWSYRGIITLPLCPNPTHNWLVFVTVTLPSGNIIVPYHFTTEGPSRRKS